MAEASTFIVSILIEREENPRGERERERESERERVIERENKK